MSSKQYFLTLKPQEMACILELLEERSRSTRGGLSDTAAHEALRIVKTAKVNADGFTRHRGGWSLEGLGLDPE